MKRDPNKCIDEYGYCPACKYGYESIPEWVETSEDLHWARIKWVCTMTDADYKKEIAKQNEEAVQKAEAD